MTIKYVVLNGPPRSGKSTIARLLTEELHGPDQPVLDDRIVTQEYFAAPMKHFIATALGEKCSDMDKDRMRPELHGYSVRQFMIHLSEDVMKPRYGEDCFARWLVHRVQKHPDALPDYVLIDDLGFDVELDALGKTYLIHVRRDRCDFKNDSRSYVGLANYDFDNNQTLVELKARAHHVAQMIREWSKR